MSNFINVIGLDFEEVCAIARTRSSASIKYVNTWITRSGNARNGRASFDVAFHVSDNITDTTVACFRDGEERHV